MLKLLLSVAASFLLAGSVFAKTLDEMFPGIANELNDEAIALLSSLDFKQGEITIGDGLAKLELTDEFYFLDAEDADFVLTELWGNPPGNTSLGMVFPVDATPIHDTWGIEISFDDIGYVSDDDAGNYDYDDLLATMQQDTRDENKWRRENNYGGIELVGWAAPPHYDAVERKLYWAKELQFEGEDSATLNYNIRILGRKGVLVVNFIAAMDHLDEVSNVAPTILALTNFTDGNRYADFDSSIDTVAAVGIGGLIAGKVLAKTGLLAVGLIFFKKFFFLLLIPLFWVKSLFSRRK